MLALSEMTCSSEDESSRPSSKSIPKEKHRSLLRMPILEIAKLVRDHIFVKEIKPSVSIRTVEGKECTSFILPPLINEIKCELDKIFSREIGKYPHVAPELEFVVQNGNAYIKDPKEKWSYCFLRLTRYGNKIMIEPIQANNRPITILDNPQVAALYIWEEFIRKVVVASNAYGGSKTVGFFAPPVFF